MSEGMHSLRPRRDRPRNTPRSPACKRKNKRVDDIFGPLHAGVDRDVPVAPLSLATPRSRRRATLRARRASSLAFDSPSLGHPAASVEAIWR